MRTVRNVFRRKLRAFLTIFGITIGVLALVVMGSMAEKLQLLVDGGIDYYGDKVVVSGPNAIMGLGVEPLSLDLIEEIEAIDGVTRVSAQVAMMLDEDISAVNMGVPPTIQAEDGRQVGYEDFVSEIADGRNLETDDHGKVVIGSDLITKLDAEVGGDVEIRGEDYEVIGILERTLTAPDQAVLMTLEDAQDIFTADLPPAVRDVIDPRDIGTSFAVYVEEGADPDDMATTIEEEIGDISAMGPTGFVEQVQEPLEIFGQIIYAVALLSLLIGGLSVINTMTMSVAERTREIGIRKAIGATDGAIMRQFISESAFIGLIGGLIGLGFGAAMVAAANAAGAASATELFLLTPRLALGSVAFALVLGVASGLFPARHAAKMNPVAALRYE